MRYAIIVLALLGVLASPRPAASLTGKTQFLRAFRNLPGIGGRCDIDSEIHCNLPYTNPNSTAFSWRHWTKGLAVASFLSMSVVASAMAWSLKERSSSLS